MTDPDKRVFDDSLSLGNQPKWKIIWYCLIVGDLRAAFHILFRG